MADKDTVSDWGVCLWRHLQVLAALFPECFHLNCMVELKCDHFYGGLPKCLNAMVAYLKASPQEKTYSDYLWAAREVEKEDSTELSQSTQNQKPITQPNLGWLVSSPCGSLRGPSWHLKHPPCTWHTWKRRVPRRTKKWKMRIPMVSTESLRSFTVHLAGARKDAQVEEKCCYHCSSLEHFICDFLLVRALRANMQLNCKEGMVPKKGVQAPQTKATIPKTPRRRPPRHRTMHSDSLLESWSLSVLVQGQECGGSEDQGRGLYGPPQQWHTNKYHHAQLFEELLTGGGANYWPDQQKSCMCRSEKCLHPTPRLHYCQGSSGWSPGLQWGPNSPGSPRFIEFHGKDPHYLRDSHYKSIINVIKEREIDALVMPWANARVAHLLSV